MRIYRIAKKEVKLSGLFGQDKKTFKDIAMQFVKDYWDRIEKMPTVGDVILHMMDSDSLDTDNVDQDFLKTVAQSVLATMNSSLAQV